MASCLDVAEVHAGFERSNLLESEWARHAGFLDDMCEQQGVQASDLGAVVEFSQVEVYRAPEGTPGVTDTHFLAVLGLGLVLMKEEGLFRKRTDSQFMFFSEFEGGIFRADESIGDRGWGHMDIQAARGSVPLFRLGWYFDERSSDRRHAINAAANERDRVLAAIEWGRS